MFSLEDWGWDPFFSQQSASETGAGYEPGRVTGENKGLYRLICSTGEYWGEPSGRLWHQSAGGSNRPTVGDWILVKARAGEDRVVIHRILERKNELIRLVGEAERRRDHSGDEQVLASNLDYALIVSSLNRDLNLRRLERYLALAYGCRVRPVILLTKADLCPDPGSAVARVTAATPGVEVLALSVLGNQGLSGLQPYLGPGRTSVLLGSSGVGKSTLLNHLLGVEVMATGEVRADDQRGRHTTTSRQLFHLPQGGMIIDTPGLRAIGLTGGEEDLAGVFSDIDRLSEYCRYQDCRHQGEPDCAVREALEAGTLDEGRYQGYLKLQKELAFQNRAGSGAGRRKEKQRQKEFSRMVRSHYKHR